MVQNKDIGIAVRQPLFITDPMFEGYQPRISTNGNTDMFGGGFSQVIPMYHSSRKTLALKVWNKEIENNESRYGEIKEYLNTCNLPYFVKFNYRREGLWVPFKNDGVYLDTLSMDWVEGTNIADYISLNVDNAPVLSKLSDRFMDLTEDLHKNKISHGDLQHGNIMILENGNIRLIDYDSLCIPNLAGQQEFIRGLRCYQHPWRFAIAETKTSPHVDYFSELIIYLSIVAIIENPLLWEKYNCKNAEHFLFKEMDFYHFRTSAIRRDLYLLSNKVKKLTDILEDFISFQRCYKPFVYSVRLKYWRPKWWPCRAC